MNIKRILSCLFASVMLCGVVGCGNSSNNKNNGDDGDLTESNGKPHSTMSPIANVAPPALEAQPDVEDPGEEIEYTVSGTIGSDMVVQRNSYFNVFGWSENKGGIIYGEFMGEKRYAVIDENGEWCIKFSSHEATKEAQTLKIYPKTGKTIEYDGILVGDVWVVSGQSNAELQLSFALNKNPSYVKQIKNDDNIRLFTQGRDHALAAKSKLDLTKPQDNTLNKGLKWKTASAANAKNFSAIGYYFAKEMSKETDVPIGMVMAAAGGAVLHELMPNEVSSECGFTSSPNGIVGIFYNALIHPFTKNSIAGMLFYQGESESYSGKYKTYAANLEKTVAAYRKTWGVDFPFINVQLTTHLGPSLEGWYELPNIRAVQFDAYRNIENSYLVVSRDHGIQDGDGDWAHPYDKFDIGKRAADIALSLIYGKKDIAYSASPEPVNVKWEKDYVLLDFRYVGDGLKILEGNALKGFSVLDSNGKDILMSAEIIDKDTVKLTVSGKAEKVQYCMIPNGALKMANLGSSTEYPAPAFEVKK